MLARGQSQCPWLQSLHQSREWGLPLSSGQGRLQAENLKYEHLCSECNKKVRWTFQNALCWLPEHFSGKEASKSRLCDSAMVPMYGIYSVDVSISLHDHNKAKECPSE